MAVDKTKDENQTSDPNKIKMSKDELTNMLEDLKKDIIH